MAEYIDKTKLIADGWFLNRTYQQGANTMVYESKKIEDIPSADVAPVVSRDLLMEKLSKYFSIGDSYTYELTRVKEAFEIGTMELDDFSEWEEYNISDLCDYLMREIFNKTQEVNND